MERATSFEQLSGVLGLVINTFCPIAPNFTLVNDTIQLKLNFNTQIYIQDDVKLRLVKNMKG